MECGLQPGRPAPGVGRREGVRQDGRSQGLGPEHRPRGVPDADLPRAVRGVQFSPDGRRLATACHEHVQLWDAQTGQEQVLRFPCRDRHGHLDEVAFSPDGRRLAAVGGHTAVHPDREVKVWDAQTGEEIFSLPGHVGGLQSVAFSPDGRRLVSAGLDQTVKLWDAATGDEVLTLRGHLDNVISVAFSPDGCKLASASVDNTVRIWDATPWSRSRPRNTSPSAGTRARSPTWPSTPGTGAACFRRHGRDGPGVGLSGAARNSTTRQRTTVSQRLRVAYSPDGRRLAVSAGTRRPSSVWDATIEEPVRRFADHTAAVGLRGVQPGRPARRFGGLRFHRAVWDATTAKEVRALRDDAPAQEVLGRKGRARLMRRVQPRRPAPRLGQRGQHRPRLGLEATARSCLPGGYRTRAASPVWRSAATASGWPRPAGTGPSRSGTPRRGSCCTTCTQPAAIQCVAFGRDGRGWSGAAPTAPSRSGTGPARRPTSCAATRAGSRPWPSAPTASGSPRPAWTGP